MYGFFQVDRKEGLRISKDNERNKKMFDKAKLERELKLSISYPLEKTNLDSDEEQGREIEDNETYMRM